MVRLTDIIQADQDKIRNKEKRTGDQDAPGETRKDDGYSVRGAMRDLRGAFGSFPNVTPGKKEGIQLKGLFVRDQDGEEKKEEKRPLIPRSEMEKVYGAMMGFVSYIFAKAKGNGPFHLNEGTKMVDFIVKTPEALDVLYEKAISRKTTADALFANSVNVSIYSLKIGTAMKFDQKKLLRLGIAGLAHDIGMARVPEHIAGKTRKLLGDEFETLKSHPKLGAEMLKPLGPDYSWLAEAVYQEHERENGKGYPQGLAGDRINEFARIIAVGDVYDALTSPRPHRKPFPPFEAVKEIVQSQKEFYWPKAVKTLLDDFSAFPVNSYVRLSSGAVAKVAELNKTAPLRPKVIILFNAKGEAQNKGEVVDLQKNPLHYVTGSLSEEDIPKGKTN